MRPNIPIGLLAGVAAAILFLLATFGALPIRMFMLALVLVPIAMAGLSFNASTGLLAALTGLAGVAVLFRLPAVALYALAALPIVWLIYLTLLRREDDDGGAEWYPIGRVVFAATVIAAAVFSMSILPLISDEAVYRKSIDDSVGEILKQGLGGLPAEAKPTPEQISALGDILAIVVPAAGAATILGCLLGSLYLGGQIARAAGTLVRPWPDISNFRLPAGSAAALAVSMAAALLMTGPNQAIALSFAGAFYAAYVMQGLAIIHALTRGAAWRTPALAMLYTVLILNLGVTVLLAMLGLADSLLPLRRGTNSGGGAPPRNGPPPRMPPPSM